jgi:hypothetical protein
MTLLSMAQAVANETKGEYPASLAGNTSPASQQYMRLINKTGKRLMKKFTWNILKTEYTFTSTGTETVLTSANMPSDFNRFTKESFWDRSGNNLISGPIQPFEWNGLKAQTYFSDNYKFIMRGGAILTSPVIDANANMAFEYISENWADIAATGSPKAEMTIDTDVSRIDEEVIIAIVKAQWLKDEGQPYLEAENDAKETLDVVTGNDSPTANVAVAGDIFSQNSRHTDGQPRASRVYYGGLT